MFEVKQQILLLVFDSLFRTSGPKANVTMGLRKAALTTRRANVQIARQSRLENQENINPNPLPLPPSSPSKHLYKAQARADRLQRELRNERKKTSRRNAAILALKKDLTKTKFNLKQTCTTAERAAVESSAQLREAEHKVRVLDQEVLSLWGELTRCRKVARNLKKSCSRIPTLLKKAIAKAKSIPRAVSLKSGGMYLPKARALARVISKAGCAQAKVGMVIQCVAEYLGVKIKSVMSRRTIGRADLEGGVSATLQLGYEMMRTNGGWNTAETS